MALIFALSLTFSVLLTATIINANPIITTDAVATEFVILHNNDMHARFEQTSAASGKCSAEDANANKCYGGFARVAYEVRKYRNEEKNGGFPVIYLNAGDTYTGTPWFAIFRDNITAAFLNLLQPDAISLGNHEFDEGVEGLVPLLNEVEFPVLAANLDLTKTPELAATKRLANSTVLTVNGERVGVIGYLTPDTKNLVTPNDVEYIPEVDAINAESAKMVADGIKIIIALGHSGYQKDQDIAANCPDVDIVIGGHSHSFLYTGDQPDTEHSEGPYPTVVTQNSGKKVPVVQAYAYTKYLGKLHVQFDAEGNLIEFDGSPILLDSSVPREEDVLKLLEVYRPNITALEESVVGHTKVLLEGRATVCRKEECNLGNLISDSMVFSRVVEDQGGLYWTDAPIAVLGGGGIRSSIEKTSDGEITEQDIVSVLPFKNDLYVTKVTGKTIRNALQHSAELRDQDSNGGFLQMSGLHVTYNFLDESKNFVESVDVRCGQCDVPNYEPLNDTQIYSVVVTEFLKDGGDGHIFVEKDGPEPVRLQKNDQEALIQYLMQRDYVYPEIEGRISITEKSSTAGLMASFVTLFITFSLRKLIG